MKAKSLRELLTAERMSMIMEAHNGLSARIVDAAGFPALWASGLSIATAMGLRDASEGSWTEVSYALDQMLEATRLPILFDADTGFGNFNTFRRVVRRLCRNGIAGVVIEDKKFPKLNSFLEGNHSLVEIGEFCGKLRAGKDSQTNDGFCVVARTEALIAGLSADVALDRCEQYRAAGADAIFIHSRKSDGKEVIDFARLWDRRLPLIVAPTTYHSVDPKLLEKLGVRIYICANHCLRASLKAMYDMCHQVMAEASIAGVEPCLSPLSQLFSLLNYDELRHAEKKYS